MSDKKIGLYEDAIFEAQRFIKKARLAVKEIKRDEYAAMCGCKETGAAKRSSMDLTRSLSELRKGKAY
jgi:hypothetical protein